jgi:2-keto-4-pentenoate hydratase/2-oxohepta-3-ene-1,7-dioic acid hydratase in catechol pathway
MRYCRIQTSHGGPKFAQVESQNGQEVITRLLQEEGFPEAPRDQSKEDPSFERFLLSDAIILCPVVPSKIVCVGRNYREHAAELGNDVPKEPLLFLKPPSSLLEPGGIIRYPRLSSRVDFEGELGIVIGRRARNIDPGGDVRSYIRGYTIVNDVTARDLQKSDGQWTRGKGFDTFCPVGPIVTDEIDPISSGVDLQTHLNGVQKQVGNTNDFIFDIPTLLRYITAFLTLEPGDLIPTGTPAGVAPMQPGDRVTVSIAGIGVLSNRVAREND